jgi:hypothetical protein
LIAGRALTDVPDSCYRRSGFSVNDSEESVYGDQGQEVAWEVRQDRFNTKRQQEEIEDVEVARQVRDRSGRSEQGARRVLGPFGGIGEERSLDEYEAQCRDGVS